MKDINIPATQLQKIKNKLKKEQAKHHAQLFHQKDNLLSLVLRGHLVVENLITQILVNFNPEMKKMADKRFIEKIDVLKFNEIISAEAYEKLITLNKLRNAFAHDINFKPRKRDIAPMLKGLHEASRKISSDIAISIGTLTGYLAFIRSFNLHYPFISTLLNRDSSFRKDRSYKLAKGDLKKYIKVLDLENWKV